MTSDESKAKDSFDNNIFVTVVNGLPDIFDNLLNRKIVPVFNVVICMNYFIFFRCMVFSEGRFAGAYESKHYCYTWFQHADGFSTILSSGMLNATPCT